MAEDLRFPFKMYSVSGDGIICTGFHEKAMEIIEITSGNVTVQIGTEFAEAHAGDFLYVPPTMVFKIEALEGEAGMRSIVFTSKHHDGFALFKSEADSYNVVDATPFKRDVVEELANACAKHGLKFGLYYSQELDWAHPHGGGYTRLDPCAGTSWDNNWDCPDRSKKDFTICFEEKIKPQVKEILTNYGDLCLIWFDTPQTISAAQTDELYRMVKTYQPACLVNSRIGNGYGDYTSAGDNEMPEDGQTDLLFETPATLNDTWGYKAFDTNWKSPEEVVRLRKLCRDRGANYLLNVGPDYLGRIPSVSCDILREAGKLWEK